MATYLLVEINCDHLEDLNDPSETDRELQPNVGIALQSIARNPHNAAKILEESDLYRVLRVAGQTGERTYADDIKKYWLWKPAPEGK